MFVFPYKMASESAKSLAAGLGVKRIKTEGSRFNGSPDKTVINWGSSALPEEVGKCNVINKPEAVKRASNKLEFFRCVSGQYDRWVCTPDWTDDRDRAMHWARHGVIIVARHKLTGNSGEGIELVEDYQDGDDFPVAPLYVKYVPKKQEYRVHVANGQVVDIQRKARRTDVPDDQINWRIRNHDNGFIFARNDLDVPAQVSEHAVNACHLTGLDFGAVDVIFNERENQAYVLEVNTSPGLTGTTLEGYVERFKNWQV